MTNVPETQRENESSRLRLVRDIASLQVKLIVDGFRDLLLVPASIVVGIYSLFGRGSRTGEEFYDLLRLGKRSEKWINLFGAAERHRDSAAEDQDDDIDRMVQRVESFMVDEYRHGRLSGQAREKLEGVISRLQSVARRQANDQ